MEFVLNSKRYLMSKINFLVYFNILKEKKKRSRINNFIFNKYSDYVVVTLVLKLIIHIV